ncbi:methyl-accepting chemotaxis protein (plasmid) [Pararobbsia alpina]|uniref:methyl-accepting chemotaxis protein n=1 Tax=Pararobbsia alpina TaxID=621374 RepID=UPI0039A6061F
MNMTVGRKLAAAFGVVIAISLIGSTISIINFMHLNQANGWNVHSYQVLRTSDEMLASMVNMETGVRGFVASGEEKFLEPYNAGKARFQTRFDEVKSLTSDNAMQQTRLATLLDMHEKIRNVDENLIALRRDVNSGKQPASALIDYFKQGNDKQAMDRYRSVATEFNRAEETLLDQRSDAVAALSTSTKLTLSISGTVTVLLAVILGTLITRGIIRALGGEPVQAAEVASQIAKGNLAAKVSLHGAAPASLMSSLEMMRQQLASVVADIQTSAESIQVSASEIADGNQNLSQRTEEQAASLEETAASMEQLTATVRQNTESALHANTLAGSACDVATKGGQVVDGVIQTMQSISDSSAKVAEIISVIEGIAFQTNILALNAAVEAARAGDHGRGFAVVAGEVRTLAQRSASAAKEIKSLITDSVSRVAIGAEQVQRAGTTMGDIVKAVRQVTDIMGEIAAASAEQGKGIEQVNVAVTQMDEVTQQNAALVEQASAAAQAMAEQANTLRDAVAVFKVGQAEHASNTAVGSSRREGNPHMLTARRALA